MIEDYALAGCQQITSIRFPSSVRSIGRAVLEDCNHLRSIFVDFGNTHYYCAGNCLIEARSRELIAGCCSSVIPDDGSVRKIARNAFAGHTGLVQLRIPGSISVIESLAFSGCQGLITVNFAEGLRTIGAGAFCGCSQLTMVNLPNGLRTIDDEAFAECVALECVVIPRSVRRIGDAVFAWCSRLSRILDGGA